MKRRDWLYLFMILCLLAVGYYRYTQKEYRLTRSQIVMDTQVEISFSSKNRNLNKVMDNAFNLIKMYDNKFSYFNQKSDLYRINHSEENPVNIDKDFYSILSLAQKVYVDSDSLYDVSVGQLTDLWNFNQAVIPDPALLIKAKENIGMNRIRITENKLYRPQGVYINLGSISKGYIVDRVIEYLKKHGAIEGYVNAGGDIGVFSQNKEPVRVGIQHPRQSNDVIATVAVNNVSVVTSGDYERYFEVDGVRYHHIINPKTGYPSKGNVSVTIITADGTLADALSTALFLQTPQKALELIKKYPGAEAIIYYYDIDGKLVSSQSEGFKKYLVSELSK